MPVRHISPSINVIEKDASAFALPPVKTQLCLIGESSKGPINEPTLVSSQEDFTTKFGKSIVNSYLHKAALDFLAQSGHLIVVRTAYDEAITYTGQVAQPFTITSSTNILKVAVDGEVTGTDITLPDKAAVSAEEMASAITAALTDSSIQASAIATANKRINLVATNDVRSLDLQAVSDDAYDIFGWATVSAEKERAWYAQKSITYTQPPVLEGSSVDATRWSSITGSTLIRLKENNNDFTSYVLSPLSSTSLAGSSAASQIAKQLEDQRIPDNTHYYWSAIADKVNLVGSSLTTNSITLDDSSSLADAFQLLGGDFNITEGTTITFDETAITLGKFTAATKGTDGNNIDIIYTTNVLNQDTLEVYYGTGTSPIETLSGWNFDENDPDNYIENYVEDNSNYIRVQWDTTGTDYFDKKTYELTYGQDGINDSMTDEKIKALSTDISNPELWEFNLISYPGEYSPAGINAIINFCENIRADCFAIVDSADGLDSDEIVVWHNGEGHGNTAKFNSSYASLYWPWLQEYDSVNRQYRWYPPSVFMCAKYGYSDNVSEVWYPPAGESRGKIIATDTRISPPIGKRDVMYGAPGNNVNPIVNFTAVGLIVWGQKTLLRSPSALDRVNVRRMVLYVEKGIVNIARPYLFELATPASWSSFSARANNFLNNVKSKYGLTDYLVVCDATTNTPDIIDQNKMVGKIFLKPTKAIETIDLYFTITSAGGSFVE